MARSVLHRSTRQHLTPPHQLPVGGILPASFDSSLDGTYMILPLETVARMPPDDSAATTGTLDRVHRSDRQATLERVIAYLAHSLGTPLNVIEGRAAMLVSQRVAEAEVKRNAGIIVEQSMRVAHLLRDVVTAVRRAPDGKGLKPAADLGAIARAAAQMLGPTARARGASISFKDEAGPAWVHGDAETLIVVLTHLLDNGIRATPDGGTVTVRLRPEALPEEGSGGDGALLPFFCLQVDDEGEGIPPDVLPRLFKPFTTMGSDRQAVGLGLFVAQLIAKEHGGWVEGVNKSGKGALFSLRLPQGRPHAE